jgi:hypothetical protein
MFVVVPASKVKYFAMQDARSDKKLSVYTFLGAFWDEIKPRWLVKMETIEGILRASTLQINKQAILGKRQEAYLCTCTL